MRLPPGFTLWRRLVSHPLSIRNTLLFIILLAAIPSLIFSAILLQRYADSERARAEQTLIESAKGVARAIDAEFGAVEAILIALTGSTRLQNDDLAGFEQQLRAVSARNNRDFALLDPQKNVVLSTSRSAVTKVILSGSDSTVTNVMHIGPDELAAYVIVPVQYANMEGWTLQARVKSEEFSSILAEPGVPPDWIVSIVDRTGTHFIRSHGNERFAGRPLVPQLVEQLQRRDAGIQETVSLESIPLIATVAFASRSGWAAAIGLPTENLTAPLREQLVSLLVLAIPAAAIALLAGILLAGLLNQSMNDLKQMARSVGDDSAAMFSPTLIRDTNEVGEVLADTSRELKRRRDELDLLNATLEDRVAVRTAELTTANLRLENEIALREKTEAQVRQMQKMEAVGQLTGGIAHDFNNILAVILSSLNLMRRRLSRGETNLDNFISEATKAAERAASLVSRLLAFSRQQALSPEVIEPNRLISGLEDMLRRTLPETISVEMVLAGGLWKTHADPGGLENTLVNLAVNARDAMPEGGKLTFETANAFLDEKYAVEHPEIIKAGQYVMIAVTDTGSGMAPDVLDRVFEPFYTTKPVGKGTGLGLSQVYGFIKQSGGHVKIYSEQGVGTTIKLYLPRYIRDGAHQNPARTLQAASDGSGTGELVLIVEDDPDVRRMTVEMLRELNYDTIEAENGEAALKLIESEPKIALMLTDVVMPKMNGRALADAASVKRPDLKVLFTTGYTRNAIIHNGVLDQGVHLIIKPYDLESLSHKLHEVLRSEE
jgi:signal transduction histidine kinase/ActR/RegA family two-component response regulator